MTEDISWLGECNWVIVSSVWSFWQTWHRYSNTLLPCCLSVVITVKIRSTNRLPDSLCVPNDFRRHKTARRNARSAWLFVGSTPSIWLNVHSDNSSFRILEQVLLVFECGDSVPSNNKWLTFSLIGSINFWNSAFSSVPSRTCCHNRNSCLDRSSKR